MQIPIYPWPCRTHTQVHVECQPEMSGEVNRHDGAVLAPAMTSNTSHIEHVTHYSSISDILLLLQASRIHESYSRVSNTRSIGVR